MKVKNTSVNHHIGAKITTDFMLAQWKKGLWLNNFISNKVATRKSSATFPSVDKEFDDDTTKSVISCEFKPATETKRGILTGLGQAVAYLNEADASYLIAPAKIDDFNMEQFLKDTFKNSIKGKLPIGLICFDHINNRYENIRLAFDIDPSLKCSKTSLSKSEVSYWAIWRDNPPIGIVRLIHSCALKTNETSKSKWKYFFDNYYAPPKTRSNFDLIANDLYMWEPNTFQIPFKTKKKEICNYLNNHLTRSEIIAKENYESNVEEDGKKTKDKMYYFENIPKNENLSKNDLMQLLANHCWEEGMLENIYQGYKKNYKNFPVHTNLITGDWNTTALGNKFLHNSLNIINETKDDLNAQSNRLNDELAKILLVQGKHHNLILDLLDAQQAISEYDDINSVIGKCEKYMDAKGFLPRNPNRKTTGSRKFLQAERQLWMHLKLLQKNNDNSLFIFDEEKIEALIESFYEEYGSIYKNS